MSNKIRIDTAPGADRYAGPDEKIIEFSSPNGGGLIRFWSGVNVLRVEVYRTDDTVTVVGPMPPAVDEDEDEVRERVLARIPADFPVRPIDADAADAWRATRLDVMTCGTCGLSWDDAVSTEYTPAPSGRCPFEAFHDDTFDAVSQARVARPVDAYRLNAALAVSVERARAARAAGRDLALPEGINVATWADGWGRWHARVDFPEPGVSSEVADVNAGRLLDMARRAVRDQVAARQGDQDPTVSVVPESREVGADGRTLTLKFVEAAT